MSEHDDIRMPGYFDRFPKGYEALQFVVSISPENFLRFTRMAIEMRETMHQRALQDASHHVFNKG